MEDVKIKVLGTVSPRCEGVHNCPGFLIYNGDDKLLLDCGNGSSRYMNMPKDLYKLNIFLSHLHKDHYLDLFSIVATANVAIKKKLLEEKIKIFFPHYDKKYDLDYRLVCDFLKNKRGYLLYEYDENCKQIIGDLNISFLKNFHKINAYSTKIETPNMKFIYTSDTGYDSAENLIRFASEADLLICDSNFIKEHNISNRNHLHAYQAAEIAKEANVKKLLLTHFCPETDKIKYLEEAKPIFENTDIAEEGMILSLKK